MTRTIKGVTAHNDTCCKEQENKKSGIGGTLSTIGTVNDKKLWCHVPKCCPLTWVPEDLTFQTWNRWRSWAFLKILQCIILSGENSQVAKSRAAFVYFTLVEVTCPNCLRSCKACGNILVLFCIVYTLLDCLFSWWPCSKCSNIQMSKCPCGSHGLA